ncbi:MAG: SDR family oxidoreductase [Alphaproteobacteria bacterium]|nr:SDR family oxidoreductase [Alphaproteobacteria bacterium]
MSQDAKPLAGLHALVTGGGHGIGAAIAAELAGLGADLTLTGRNRTALRATAEALGREHGTKARVQEFDLASSDAIAARLAEAAGRLGPVAILVNNAGVAPAAALETTDLAHWRGTFDVNLFAAVLCCKAVLPDMRSMAFGRIVNIASTAGLIAYAGIPAYVASKHALIGFTRALALDLAKTQITVNAVCPGYADTEMAKAAIANLTRAGRTEGEARALLTRRNPQGQLVAPQEVARAVGWLCLPGSAAMTGQAIAVAGGEVM